MPTKPTTIDEYLAGLNEDQRAALEGLRKAIRAAAPRAEECISYGLAAFRLDGRALVAMGARPNHCAFYPMSSKTIPAHKDLLKNYVTGKGTVRFPADKPLPAALVRKLVKARIAENENLGGKAGRPASVTRSAAKSTPRDSQSDPAVVKYLQELDHPRKAEIEAVRQIILGVSPEIREGIKWNAPSFRTSEYFATVALRARDGEERVWLILHLGARVKDDSKAVRISDPDGLLQWRAEDRALITFADGKEIKSRRRALEAVIREWIQNV